MKYKPYISIDRDNWFFQFVTICCGCNNPPLLFLLQAKGKPPPTKISTLFPNPLPLEPNAIPLPTLKELGAYLDGWLSLMGANYSSWSNDSKCIHNAYWTFIFVDICMMELTHYLQTFCWFWSAWLSYLVSRLDVLLHVLDEVVVDHFLISEFKFCILLLTCYVAWLHTCALAHWSYSSISN